MKKLALLLSIVFAVAIALSITIPALAATDTGTVTISGSIQPAIDVTAPDIATVGNLIPDTSSESIDQTVTVNCNKAGWTLTASDTKTTNKGHMRAALGPGIVALINPIEIKGNGKPYAYLNASVTLVDGSSSVVGTTNINDINFRQATEWADAVDGIYIITVTFTATTS